MSGVFASTWQTLHADRSAGETTIARRTLRRAVGFARPHRRLVTLYLVGTVFHAGLVVVPPLVTQRLVDHGILAGDVSAVVFLATAMAAAAVADAGLGLLTGSLSSRIGESLIYDLRTQVFAHVQGQSLAFFNRTQTGALVSRLNSDVIGAQSAFTSVLSGAVFNIVSTVTVGATMVALSWRVTLGCLLLFPPLLLTSRWVSGRLAALTRSRMDQYAALGVTMTERFNISGALLLKLFGHSQTENARFAQNAATVRDLGIRIAVLNRVFIAALTLVPALATALVYGVGGYLVVHGHLSVGTVLALGALLLRLLGPLQGLSNTRMEMMTALVSFDRVFEVLDLPSSIQERPDAVELPKAASSLVFEKVSFRYPHSRDMSPPSLHGFLAAEVRDCEDVLHEVTFTAEPGQMIALVGPSGAGKTTITHLLARLYDADTGTVRVGGHDIRDLTLESLHHAVGYVTQDAHMFHDTIRVNLLYARPEATEHQIWQALEAAHIAELVADLPAKLDTVVGDHGHRLSGGERQRLAIARLLLKAPSIVVLDEATAHLDNASEAAVQRALHAALSGRTSLVIAHRLSTVRNADLILVMRSGRIVQRGTHAQLLHEGGLYAELYHGQLSDGIPA